MRFARRVFLTNVRLVTAISLFLVLLRSCYFSPVPAEDLWKGVTTVSNAGKKRGRGKTVNRRNIKDLNRGQVIGIGKANVLWPGLSAPVVRGRELVRRQTLPEDPEREAKLLRMRDEMGSFRRLKLSPIERGWSGAKLPGRSVGPPDPVDDETFDGFDTKVLETKTVFNMKGNFGRKRRLSVLVVAGNGNGLAGFASAKALDTKAAVRKAKNRAGRRLMRVAVADGHTVCHDFFTRFGRTKMFVGRRPEGHGLVCHRAIKTICEVVGIRDLHAKIEGSTNLQHVVKAFFVGLLRQKTHRRTAEEKRLHVVEFRRENDRFPTVVASPTAACRTEEEIAPDEILDFGRYCLDGRVALRKKERPRFYTKLDGWRKHLKKTAYRRSREKIRTRLLCEYGELRSFLAEKYPECTPYKRKTKNEEDLD